MLVFLSSFSVKDDLVSVKFPCSFYHYYIFSNISDFHFATSYSEYLKFICENCIFHCAPQEFPSARI